MKSSHPLFFDPADDLYALLDEGRFLVYYQPIIDLLSFGKTSCVGAEALLRYRDKEGYVTSAYRFMDQIDSFQDFRVTVSRFVIDTVLSDLNRLERKDFKISVNISPDDLLVDSFFQWLLSRISPIKALKGRLAIEINESFTRGDHYADKIALLKQSGLMIWLDDMGRECSNLSRLAVYPDYVKIDRFFVPSELNPDAVKGCLLCHLAASLFGAKSILEGIEYPEQLAIARALGIQEGQGFLWSKAVPFDVLLDQWVD